MSRRWPPWLPRCHPGRSTAGSCSASPTTTSSSSPCAAGSQLPSPLPGQPPMDPGPLLAIYRATITARRLDEAERDLVRRGEAFFHVSGAGHEASAALAPHLHAGDFLHCHYRDKALLLRGVPVVRFLTALLCRAPSPSAG